ncbi:LytR/AlgR family response regulator transcription factor [Jiulongibacter sp. NS-SX5]|uniref:LytR/AlgR family response regulator transcription factor n=1 Tax=Jiulongibacter sp. NS-SX5 TaxID=3463854 RepID=UPI004059D876
MPKLKVVLIDDENHCNETLEYFIKRDLPDLEIVSVFTKPLEATEYLLNHNVDLVFMDIQMPKMTGFDILEKIPDAPFDVIFVTAFDQYAIQAIKFSALDYILKPVQADEIQLAVKKVLSRTNAKNRNELYQKLVNYIKSGAGELKKVSFPTSNGLIFISTEQLMWCEASGNYATLKLISGEQYQVNKNLRYIEELLDSKEFIRTHNSYLVNRIYVESYVKADGGYLEMKDGKQISISRGKKDELLERLL